MKQQAHIKLIASIEESLRDMKAAVTHIRTHRNTINKVATIARKSGEAHVYSAGNMVYVNIQVRGLDGFKAGKLTRVLSRMTRATGIEFTSTDDYPEAGNRDFRGRGDLFVVTVSAYLNDAPKNCRKVIVRTERVERPVYELICK